MNKHLIIEDLDIQIDAHIDVCCSKLPDEPQGIRTWRCAGTPAIAAALEVDAVAMRSLTLWMGSEPCVVVPVNAEEGARIARWVRDHRHDEIVEKMKENDND